MLIVRTFFLNVVVGVGASRGGDVHAMEERRRKVL